MLTKILRLCCVSFMGLFFMQAAQARLIKFATEATYPPFVYMDNHGEIRGFDIEIAKAICESLKFECTFTNQPWDSLIPSLQFGKFDALIGAISITPERQEKVLFTDAYYENKADYVIPINQPSLAIKKGTIIGVQAGTTLADYLMETYGDNIKINRYASAEQAFLDLIATRLDAVFGDQPVVTHWVKNAGKDQFKLANNVVYSPRYLGKGFGIALRKDEPDLVENFNSALNQLKKDGTYQHLYQHYFD